jgi:hypothetical protein
MADSAAHSPTSQPKQENSKNDWILSLEKEEEQDKRSEPWKAYANKLGDQPSNKGRWEQGEHGVHWVDIRHEGPETS